VHIHYNFFDNASHECHVYTGHHVCPPIKKVLATPLPAMYSNEIALFVARRCNSCDQNLYILQHILLGLVLLQNIHGATISLFGGYF